MTRTYWTYRAYCDRRALIADRLNIRPEDVSFDQSLAYDAGEMEPMEACDWHRQPASVLSSGPYASNMVFPASVGAAHREAAQAFPDFDDWPGMPNTLLTEGSGGA